VWWVLGDSPQACGGVVMKCLADKQEMVTNAKCRKELFVLEKKQVNDWRKDAVLNEVRHSDWGGVLSLKPFHEKIRNVEKVKMSVTQYRHNGNALRPLSPYSPGANIIPAGGDYDFVLIACLITILS
jgi:hypothetical protein